MFLYSIGDSLVDSLVCIVIVFLILLLICFVVGLFKYIKVKEVNKPINNVVAPKRVALTEITDDDMMVACLVACIDFRQTEKTDVRVVSVRELK